MTELGITLVAVTAALAASYIVTRRVRARLAVRKVVTDALSSVDASTRMAAVRLISTQGITAYAPALLARAHFDNDPLVLDEIAIAVSRNQWAPISNPHMSGLRSWARHRLSVAQSTGIDGTTAELTGAEGALFLDPSQELLLPHVDAATQYESTQYESAQYESAQYESAQYTSPNEPISITSIWGQMGSVAAGSSSGSRNWSGSPASSGRFSPSDSADRGPALDPVGSLRVLVLSGGGAADEPIIASLASRGHTASVVEIYRSSVHDRGRATRYFPGEPGFTDSVIASARATDSQVLVVVDPSAVTHLALDNERLLANGIATFLPTAQVISLCENRLVLAQRLAKLGIWVAFSDMTPPEATIAAAEIGRGFSIEALVNRRGDVVASVPMWEVDHDGDLVTRARTFSDPEIETTLSLLVSEVGIRGMASLRGIVDAEGAVSVVNVAPYFSGALALSGAGGCDLAGQYLQILFKRPLDLSKLHNEPGFTSELSLRRPTTH